MSAEPKVTVTRVITAQYDLSIDVATVRRLVLEHANGELVEAGHSPVFRDKDLVMNADHDGDLYEVYLSTTIDQS